MNLLTPTNILRASVIFAIGATCISANRILDSHKAVSNLVLETDEARRQTIRIANGIEARESF